MFRRSLMSGSVLVFGMLMCVPSFAQDHYVNRLYGQGVHAFHRGDYGTAQRLLDESINAGSKDPRAYYYRAFTKARTGGGLDQSDISTGAGFEVDGYNGNDIGRSLERVQGSQRVEFERARTRAKLAATRALRARGSSGSTSFGSGAFRSRPGIGPAPQDLPAGPDATDPFSGDGAGAGDANPFNNDDPAPGGAADDDNLFGGDEPAPPAEADDDNLFGGGDAAGAAEEDDNLFGGGGDAAAGAAEEDDNLFGGGDAGGGDEGATDLPPAGGPPAGDEPAGGVEDLFDSGDEAPSDDGGSIDDLFG